MALHWYDTAQSMKTYNIFLFKIINSEHKNLDENNIHSFIQNQMNKTQHSQHLTNYMEKSSKWSFETPFLISFWGPAYLILHGNKGHYKNYLSAYHTICLRQGVKHILV